MSAPWQPLAAAHPPTDTSVMTPLQLVPEVQPQHRLPGSLPGPQLLSTAAHALQLLVPSASHPHPGATPTLAPVKTLDLRVARPTAQATSSATTALVVRPMPHTTTPVVPAAAHNSLGNTRPSVHLTHPHDTSGQGAPDSPLAALKPQGAPQPKRRKRTRPAHHLCEAEVRCTALEQQVQQLEAEQQRLQSREQLLQLAVRCRESQAVHLQLLGFVPSPAAPPSVGLSRAPPTALALDQQGQALAPALPAPLPCPLPPALPTREHVQHLRIMGAAVEEVFGGLHAMQTASTTHLATLMGRVTQGPAPQGQHTPSHAPQPQGANSAWHHPAGPLPGALVAACTDGRAATTRPDGLAGVTALPPGAASVSVAKPCLKQADVSTGPPFMVAAPTVICTAGPGGLSLAQLLAGDDHGEAPGARLHPAGPQVVATHLVSLASSSAHTPVSALLGGLTAAQISMGSGSVGMPLLGGLTAAQINMGSGSVGMPLLGGLTAAQISMGSGSVGMPLLGGLTAAQINMGSGSVGMPLLGGLTAAQINMGSGSVGMPLLGGLTAAQISMGSGSVGMPLLGGLTAAQINMGSGSVGMPLLGGLTAAQISMGSGSVGMPLLGGLTAAQINMGSGSVGMPLLGGLTAAQINMGSGSVGMPLLGGLTAAQINMGSGEGPMTSGLMPAGEVAGSITGDGEVFTDSSGLSALATFLPLLFLCNPAAVSLTGRWLAAAGAAGGAEAAAPGSHWVRVLGLLGLSAGQLHLLCELQRLVQPYLVEQEQQHRQWAAGLKGLLRLETDHKAQGSKVQLGGPRLRQGEVLEASQKLVSRDHSLVLLVVDVVVTGILTHQQVVQVLSASWPFFPDFLALCHAATSAVTTSQRQPQQEQQQQQPPQQPLQPT